MVNNVILGYDAKQMNKYINKLFENIGEVTYTDDAAANSSTSRYYYEVTGVKSVLAESLSFNSVSSILV